MKAQDLRIGSKVDTSLGRGSVTSINITEVWIEFNDSIMGRSDALEFDVSRLKPIPLTPDELVKLGFEEVEGNNYYRFFHLNDFRVFIHRTDNDSIFMSWKSCQIDNTVNNLRLHNLQNIVKDLTGEELNYTP